ncbi:MAG: glutamine amidotransferase [Candidatus Undinarchaeales archaeon]|jgi:uncharacterized membrane protein|nr:glutamine amidotransferase [Candidatus Undinarchaeales archaeon]MDP7492630.1 glutamine amidotransferase [Candidatus Undinarchaeales archaeon]
MNVLVLGEPESAFRYIHAVIDARGFFFMHIPVNGLGTMPAKSTWLDSFDAVLLSDVPAVELGVERMKALKDFVERGGGLGMVGGWWSFTGTKGEYRGTPVEDVMPVRCSPVDDRVNDPNGYKMVRTQDHFLIEGLPWHDAPTICGFNRIEPKAGAQVLLTARRIEPVGKDRVEGVRLAEQEHPLLVVGDHGRGRTLALATDLAPHWVGGLVDWGAERVELDGTEVGDLYITFVGRMLEWLGGDGHQR